MSVERVMRCALENPSFRSGAGVLAGQLDRQTLAALLPTAAQYLATPLRFHARAEPMRLDAALVPGAIRRLSHTDSSVDDAGSGVKRHCVTRRFDQIIDVCDCLRIVIREGR